MNLSTISSLWRVFKAGESVANPSAWKQGQVTANMVTALFAALAATAKGLGYDLHVDDGTLAAVGAGLFALVNWLLTVATTDKVGILGQRHDEPAEVARAAGDTSASQQGPLAAQPRGEPAERAAPDPVRRGPVSADPAQDGVRGGP